MVAYIRLQWKPTGKSDRQLITDARPVWHWSGSFPRDVSID